MSLDGLTRCYAELDSLASLGQSIPSRYGGDGLFTRPFILLHAVSDLYTARTALGLAFDLGWERMLRLGASVDELLADLQPPSRIPAAWILEFLVEKGTLRKMEERYILEGSPDLDLQELRTVAETEAPGHLRNLDLLDAVRSHVLPYFMKGKSGDSCLFDLAVFPLWLDYFRNENIVYRSNNAFTLAALKEHLKPGSRILELGGGAGSFAQMLAEDGHRDGYLGNIAEYRFTDAAPTFLRRAQRGLKEMAPGLPFTFGALDINRPFDDQGLAGIQFDAIVGVNVLHVAKDLPATLRDLHAHLAPAGRLIMGECIKSDLTRPIYIEFFFQFMTSFTDVMTDPILRPRHGFLTPEAWVQILKHAGFKSVEEFPPTRALLDQFPAFNVGAFAAEA